MKQDSNASFKANVSAETVLLTPCFKFFDFHAMGAYLLLPHKDTVKPPSDDPFLRFGNDAALKHKNFLLSKVLRSGNFNITSDLLSLRILYLLAVSKSFIVAIARS